MWYFYLKLSVLLSSSADLLGKLSLFYTRCSEQQVRLNVMTSKNRDDATNYRPVTTSLV